MRHSVQLEATGKNHKDVQEAVQKALVAYFGDDDEVMSKDAEVSVKQDSPGNYTATIYVRMR